MVDRKSDSKSNEASRSILVEYAPSRRRATLEDEVGADQTDLPSERILTKQPCATPEQVRRDLGKCATERERTDVLLTLLERQKAEASSLAESHRKFNLNETANELNKIADQSAYAIALFNRRIRQKRQIPYLFQVINLPQANVNPDLSPDTLEVSEIRAIDYVTPADCTGNLETCIQLELAYPTAKKSQKIKSDWIRYLNGIRYLPSVMHFTVNPLADAYIQLLKLEKQLKATVYYNRGITRRSGVFGWTYFTITDLLSAASVHLTTNLNTEGGMIPGYLKLHLRHRTPVEGSYFITRPKAWLVLAVDDIMSLTNSPSMDDINKQTVHNAPSTTGEQQALSSTPVTPTAAEIIADIRLALDQPHRPQPKVSLIREKMSSLHERVQTNAFERHHIEGYLQVMTRLLEKFKTRRKDAEKNVDMQSFKQLYKREALIKEEQNRYNPRSTNKYEIAHPSHRKSKIEDVDEIQEVINSKLHSPSTNPVEVPRNYRPIIDYPQSQPNGLNIQSNTYTLDGSPVGQLHPRVSQEKHISGTMPSGFVKQSSVHRSTKTSAQKASRKSKGSTESLTIYCSDE
ncbi:hypothetical protein EG68_07636 [Paragonimus skrjabini miyazakii]|uniref:Uncharacterized protein n=1 Tax=Paragonimus skrjabini miyazakii TaxID=59628 RepID=A0A8S9YK57_9TREM|nr:hypothetical protein EG68_07636 [Paragonimus skrjabini miyazakii]